MPKRKKVRGWVRILTTCPSGVDPSCLLGHQEVFHNQAHGGVRVDTYICAEKSNQANTITQEANM